jgi:hypothetical protein
LKIDGGRFQQWSVDRLLLHLDRAFRSLRSDRYCDGTIAAIEQRGFPSVDAANRKIKGQRGAR